MIAVVQSDPVHSAHLIAAVRLRAGIAKLEGLLDQSIAAAADLAQTMIEARRDSNVPVHMGQTALIRLARAQSHLVGASSDTFRVHDVLAQLSTLLMIPDEPTTPSGLADEGPLRAVA